jgi:hypothetical protein
MKNLNLICFGLGCFSICSMQMSQAYDYHTTSESEKVAAAADREVNCAGLDAIDIGIELTKEQSSKLLATTKTGMWNKPLYFTREQIVRFLKNETHKNKLIVHVEKFVTEESFMINFRPFLKGLGYKRIMVLRDSAFIPNPVLLDETLDDADIEKKEQLQAMQEQADAVVLTNLSSGMEVIAAESQFSPQAWKQELTPQSVKGSYAKYIWRDEEFKKLLRDYDLIGMSRMQVVSLLGDPDRKIGYVLHAGGDILLDLEIQYESDQVKRWRLKGSGMDTAGPWQTTNVLWEGGMVPKLTRIMEE